MRTNGIQKNKKGTRSNSVRIEKPYRPVSEDSLQAARKGMRIGDVKGRSAEMCMRGGGATIQQTRQILGIILSTTLSRGDALLLTSSHDLRNYVDVVAGRLL